MADYITLLGSEGVERAGHNMVAAASEITRAASYIEDSLQRHREFLTQWLYEFQGAIKAVSKGA